MTEKKKQISQLMKGLFFKRLKKKRIIFLIFSFSLKIKKALKKGIFNINDIAIYIKNDFFKSLKKRTPRHRGNHGKFLLQKPDNPKDLRRGS